MITRLWQRGQSIPRNMRLFLLNVLAYGMVIDGILSVLLNLYLLRLGYDTTFIGTINSIGTLVFALVSLPIGAVQRYSSRQMMQLGQFLSLIGLLGVPLAFYIDEGQALFLIGFRVVASIGLSTYFVHQVPLVLEITRPAWHARALSLTMAFFSLAAFLGSWIGGMLPGFFGGLLTLPLTDPQPYQLTMFTAALLLIPAMIAIRLLPDRPVSEETPAEETNHGTLAAGWKPLAGLLAVILLVRALQSGGIGVVITFTNVYLDEALMVPTSRIGLITGFGRLLGVPMSLTVPWLVSRFGNFKLVHLSLGLIALLILPLALVPYWPVAALAVIGISSMGSVRYLSFIGFTMALVSDKQRSLISGTNEMAIGAGFAISSFIGGYLIAWLGYRELFLFGSALTVLGTVVFGLIFWRRSGQTARPAPIPRAPKL